MPQRIIAPPNRRHFDGEWPARPRYRTTVRACAPGVRGEPLNKAARAAARVCDGAGRRGGGLLADPQAHEDGRRRMVRIWPGQVKPLAALAPKRPRGCLIGYGPRSDGGDALPRGPTRGHGVSAFAELAPPAPAQSLIFLVGERGDRVLGYEKDGRPRCLRDLAAAAEPAPPKPMMGRARPRSAHRCPAVVRRSADHPWRAPAARLALDAPVLGAAWMCASAAGARRGRWRHARDRRNAGAEPPPD